MSYVLTFFLVLYLSNSRELTPIHIWVIEFVIFCVIACQRRDKNDVNRRSENDRNAEIVSPR